MRMLYRAVAREIRLETAGALLLLFTGSIAFSFGLGQNIFLFVVSLGLLYFGIKYMWRMLQFRQPEETPLFQTLIHSPGKIVWVYSVVTERMPFGIRLSKYGLMYFKFVDGEEITVSMPEKELRVVSRFLKHRLLPHATFGYSKEKEAQYLKDPSSLFQNYF
ncbi:MAG: hypothetical protein D6714_12850 [Bacteroidetes bacterium]|nr:MAG: hypothetical protein D6714_12850 [Bacteroidota bacterium]